MDIWYDEASYYYVLILILLEVTQFGEEVELLFLEEMS